MNRPNVRKLILLLMCSLLVQGAYSYRNDKHKPCHSSAWKALHRYFPAPSLYLVMDSSRQEGRVDLAYGAIQSPDGTPFSGKGVVVGIVDLGYDLSHPAFFSREGAYRVKRLWDQSAEAGTPPARFGYGSEYVTEQEILALERDVASGSHGTHVANIAAGAPAGSPYYGVAQESELVFVSTSLKNKEVLDGVRYIADYAREVGKPCVINLSIGGRIGPHDGTSVFDRAIDSLVSRGMLVVGAAGNDGDKKYHASRYFTSERDTLRLVNYSSGGICYADVWGDEGSDFRLVSVLSNRRTGEILFARNEWVSAVKDTSYVDSVSFGKGVIMGIFTERDSVNSRPHASVVCVYPGKGTDLCFDTRIVAASGEEVHAWAGESTEFAVLDNYTVNTSYSVMEVGGTGRSTISVGGFVSKTKTPTKETDADLFGIQSASSHGPTLDGRRKPDVTAASSLVVSAVSRFDGMFRALSIDTVSRGGVDYYYAPNQGTSMASPFVAGVVALWLQANPELSVDEVRDILQNSSWKDGRVDMRDSYLWGSGKIDAYAGLKYLLKQYPVSVQVPGTAEREMELLSTRNGLRLLFLRDVRQATLKGYTLSGEMLFSDHFSGVGAGEEIPLPRVAYSGVVLWRIFTDTRNYTYKAVVTN